MLNDTTDHSSLLGYFNWLQEIVTWRGDNLKGNLSEQIKELPAPNAEKDSVLETLIEEYNLDIPEVLILLLSLAPYYIPAFLNKKKEDDSKLLKEKLFLNTSLINKNYYPSIETALILLAGDDVTERQKQFHYFNTGSKLYKEDIIALPAQAHGEPFTRSNLIPGQSILNNMLSGHNKGPEFSHDFPATLIDSEYSWNDLVLSYTTQKQLEEVKEWIDYETLCRKKGLDIQKFRRGYKCLFFGPPGTGKTMAASLIGKLTNHKVYRIDLSAVVSKYIGETEKNLARVFDRAIHGNWILFFDEADALFGKRGVTQNAHDRYANQEVSFLLQRFETYEGVSILASNYKENIDTAFYRRFHSIVNFRKPEAEERLKLWQVHLPKEFKFSNEIKLEEIAESIKINGAGIYNVMRRSCMKAALKGDMIITGNDMYESVKLEFNKENKTF